MNHVQKGFTLIEIMIVVAIIAILAAIAIPNFISYRKTAQQNACDANIKVLNSATEAYVAANPQFDVATITTELLAPATGKGMLKAAPTCPISGLSTSYKYEAGTTNSWVCTHTVE